MYNTERLRQTLTSSKVQANIADTMDSTRTLCKKEGKNGGKETEVKNERKFCGMDYQKAHASLKGE